ncbi:MAG: tripartite tricarboxylate transporter substrate binding protein [Rhodospirillales bacterium]|nr:tripartite tricarboxylate transporter substrate binding protein [Rhodospirillales bacterium]
MVKTSWIAVAAAAVLTVALPGAASADDYPTKPVTLVVPFAAGGNNDVSARILARKLGELLGQSFVVDNRAGAGGAIGTASVANAKPDGYTLGFLSSGPMAANVSLYKSLPYDTLKDFVPIARVTTSPSVLVVPPPLPANDIGELIALAKKEPGKLNYGTAGVGSSSHLSGALFERLADIQMVAVGYRGGAPALADLMGGQLQVLINPILEVVAQVKSGKVRALGVTSAKRSALLPEVAAIAEALPGYEVLTWNGLVAPAGTPSAIVEKLNAATRQALTDPKVRAQLEELGLETAISSPAEFAAYVREQIDAFAKLARIANVEPQ